MSVKPNYGAIIDSSPQEDARLGEKKLWLEHLSGTKWLCHNCKNYFTNPDGEDPICPTCGTME